MRDRSGPDAKVLPAVLASIGHGLLGLDPGRSGGFTGRAGPSVLPPDGFKPIASGLLIREHLE